MKAPLQKTSIFHRVSGTWNWYEINVIKITSEKLKEEHNFAIYIFRINKTLYKAAIIHLYKRNTDISK